MELAMLTTLVVLVSLGLTVIAKGIASIIDQAISLLIYIAIAGGVVTFLLILGKLLF